MVFFSSDLRLKVDLDSTDPDVSWLDSLRNHTDIWMKHLSEKSLHAFEVRNNISLVHIVVLVERGDFLATILALNPDMTHHLDFEAPAAFHITPIALAAEVGNIDIVNQLIRGGASLEGTSFLGFSPLHLSIRLGHWRVAESLLEAGASPNYHEEVYRYTLFVEAALKYEKNPSEEAEDVLVSLLKNGADIRDLSVESTGSLMSLLITKCHKELLEQLTVDSEDLKLTNSSAAKLLFLAITRIDLERKEKLEMVEMLLISGVNPNLPFFLPNQTALSWVSFLGNIDLVNLLLKWGAQTLPPLPLYSPLFMAMSKSNARETENLQVSKVLVKHPFYPNFVEPHQEGSITLCKTSLSLAIQLGDSAIVWDVLKAGADPFIAGCSNAALCTLGLSMNLQLYTEEDAFEIVQAILAHNVKDINEQLDCYSIDSGISNDLLDTFLMSNYTKAIEALLDSGLKIQRETIFLTNLLLHYPKQIAKLPRHYSRRITQSSHYLDFKHRKAFST